MSIAGDATSKLVGMISGAVLLGLGSSSCSRLLGDHTRELDDTAVATFEGRIE
jgi:hypothetical protein